MRGGRRPNGKVILDGFVLCCWFFFGGHFKYMMDRFGLFEDSFFFCVFFYFFFGGGSGKQVKLQ